MIVFNIDVMLARRKMSLTELSHRVGITMANLSILKTGKARAVRGGYGNQSGKRAPLPPRPQKEKTPPHGKVPGPYSSGNSPTSSSSHKYADIFLLYNP